MLIENAIEYISNEFGYFGLWGEVKFSASAVGRRRCGGVVSVRVGYQKCRQAIGIATKCPKNTVSQTHFLGGPSFGS